MHFDGNHPASEKTGASLTARGGVLVRSCYDDVAVWVRLSCEFAARAIKLHQIASPLLPCASPHPGGARQRARARARNADANANDCRVRGSPPRKGAAGGAGERGACERSRGNARSRRERKLGGKKRAPPPCARKSLSRSLVLVLVRARAEGCRGGQAGRAGARGTQPPPRAAAAGGARGGSCERTGRGGAADLLEPGRSARRAGARGVRTPPRERAGAAGAAAGGGCGGDVGPPAGSAAPVRCSPAGRTARDAARRCVAARAPRCCARATALREARAWRAAVGVSLVEAAGWGPVKKKKKTTRAREMGADGGGVARGVVTTHCARRPCNCRQVGGLAGRCRSRWGHQRPGGRPKIPTQAPIARARHARFLFAFSNGLLRGWSGPAPAPDGACQSLPARWGARRGTHAAWPSQAWRPKARLRKGVGAARAQ